MMAISTHKNGANATKRMGITRFGRFQPNEHINSDQVPMAFVDSYADTWETTDSKCVYIVQPQPR